MKRVLIAMVFLALISCEQELDMAENLGDNAGIVGTWVRVPDISMSPVDDGIDRFKRRSELEDDNYGFTLKEDGTFIERKNSGWCGTPPIAYDNFDGSWNAVSDSLLDVTVGYWGGTMTYQMRIVSVDEEDLAIRYFYGEDRVEAR